MKQPPKAIQILLIEAGRYRGANGHQWRAQDESGLPDAWIGWRGEAIRVIDRWERIIAEAKKAMEKHK